MEEKIIVNTDGGARGNPGPAASAFVVKKGNEVIFKKGFYLGETTNNIAEYTAVLKALEWLKENNFVDKEIFFEIDSELVVRQLTGIYKVKNFQLRVLYQKIKDLEKSFLNGIFYRHIFREKNFLADKIVNEKIDESQVAFTSG
ncbi:MAG: ribonuclease H [Patescibacteria group bacterium]|nr:MAG: ribonuclease H [Patescibacteria group bacterium]